MTPRLSVIAAAIRKLGQTTGGQSYDSYWDNVVLAMNMDCDQYASNVVLAMHMDGANGSTTFTDLKGKTVTPSGNAQISTTQSKFGGASAYFDGLTTSYLTVSNPSGELSLDGDFTIEYWINSTTTASLSSPIGSAWDISTAGFKMFNRLTGLNVVTFSTSENGYVDITANVNVNDGVWHHIAVVRLSGVVTIYVDGVSSASGIRANTIIQTQGVVVGKHPSDNQPFTGYIDDLRITKGVARYTANFTPPTSAFEPLLTSFIDLKGHTVTVNGNAVIQTTTKKFGTGSAYFDGADNYLTLTPSSSFDFSSVDFTVECWINPTSVSAIQVIATCRNSGTGDGWLLFVSASGALSLQGTSGSPSDVTSAVSAVSAGEWSHVAACKSGSTTYLFVNGALVASGVIGIGPSGSETLYIGRHHLGAGYNFYGYIDDLRITKGVARYTSSFTPPSAMPTQSPP